jgi:glycine/D-amino acid oxidase-like deaminating enzyme
VHLGRVAPDLAATILPVTTYAAVTEPIPRLNAAVAFSGAVTDRGSADSQYRVIDNERLLWSCGATVWQGQPHRYARRIPAAIEHLYPQLRAVAISQAWAGTTGVAVHRMPQIGELSPGLWLANAFAGHGINTTAMAGDLIARAIVEHDDTWRLFLPYDLVWAGGLLGRAVMQASAWVRGARDTARGQLARRSHERAPTAA